MKRKRYTEEQIHKILKEAETSGMSTEELCRKHGISPYTFYRWRSKYGGMELSDLKKMKSLEAENSQLKRIVAEKELDIQALKAVLEKKW